MCYFTFFFLTFSQISVLSVSNMVDMETDKNQVAAHVELPDALNPVFQTSPQLVSSPEPESSWTDSVPLTPLDIPSPMLDL